jgi:hypothetical protein
VCRARSRVSSRGARIPGSFDAVLPGSYRRAVTLHRHRDIRTPRLLLVVIAAVAVLGAVSPLHGAPPAIALGSPVLWRVQIGFAVAALVWPMVRALVLAWHGKLIGVRDPDDDTSGR